MGLSCGIVGLPNVGKSTLFNGLLHAKKAPSENYPFCTVDPNVGIITVPDPRLEVLAKIVVTDTIIPTTIEFVDIAGLVKGASKGEGLGNQFLSHIREVDAIVHVVRCFEDPDVIHVEGGPNPKRDIETINLELCLADLGTLEKRMNKVEKLLKGGSKEARAQMEALNRALGLLNKGQPLRLENWTEEERSVLQEGWFLTRKPVIYCANVSEEDIKNPAVNPLVAEVVECAKREGARTICVCGKLEEQLAELSPEEGKVYLESMGMKEGGLGQLIREGYSLLKLRTFFTSSPKEVRAWTITAGAKAPQAAGKIHTDFERGFIKAEVVSYNDFIQHGGWQGAREAGVLRIEGKTYEVQDGDQILFRFNV